MLAIRGLRHAYGNRTVLRVDEWSVARGEHALVLGPSGSGKSTLLNVVAGLAVPSEGTVLVDGEPISTLSAARRDAFRARRLGLVPQRLHLIDVISVRDNLRLAQRLAGLPPDDGRIDEVLESLGLPNLSNARASSLSVGEAQRVSVARAVLNRPALVLADEPTSALDDASCERTISLLLDQCRAWEATLIVATHDQRIAPRFARRLTL